jgi:hypothetical protein
MGCALAAAESVCCRCRGGRAACGAAFESTAAGDGAYLCARACTTAAMHCNAGRTRGRRALRCVALRCGADHRRGRAGGVMRAYHPYLVGVRPHANANGRRFGSIEEGEDREVGPQKSQPEYYRHMIISINWNDDVGDCVTNCRSNIRDAGWHDRLDRNSGRLRYYC